MEQLLAGLGSRIFLMNNVHDDAQTVFHVRWVMSYLRGPLVRRQIKQLMEGKRQEFEASAAAAPTPAMTAPKPSAPEALRPRLPKGAEDYYIPSGPGVPPNEINYVPAIIRVGDVKYSDSKKGISGTETVAIINRINTESGEPDWSQNLELPNGLHFNQLGRDPLSGTAFTGLPQSLLDSKFWSELEKNLVDELYNNHSITVFKSPLTGAYSNLGEREGDFRARLVHEAHELRDKKVADMRSKYQKKIATLEGQIERAMDHVAEQKSQSSRAKMDTAIRVGSTILSAVMGRSVSSRSRSAMSGASNAWKESRDVSRAEEKVDDLKEKLQEIEAECEREIEELKQAMDPMKEALEEIHLTPYKKNCSAKVVGVVWMPYRVDPQPTLGAAW